jgi:hypothetical protein
MLMQGSKIIEAAILSLPQLTEEGQEPTKVREKNSPPQPKK